MRAGKLDRRIEIQRQNPGKDGHGGLSGDWMTIAEVFAEWRPDRGGERFVAQQTVGKGRGTFLIRWASRVSDLTVKDRIVFEKREYEVLDVREIGRRRGIEIDVTVRSETVRDGAA